MLKKILIFLLMCSVCLAAETEGLDITIKGLTTEQTLQKVIAESNDVNVVNEARYDLIIMKYDNQDYIETLNLCNDVIKDSNDIDAYLLSNIILYKGWCTFRLGDETEALSLFNSVINDANQNADQRNQNMCASAYVRIESNQLADVSTDLNNIINNPIANPIQIREAKNLMIYYSTKVKCDEDDIDNYITNYTNDYNEPLDIYRVANWCISSKLRQGKNDEAKVLANDYVANNINSPYTKDVIRYMAEIEGSKDNHQKAIKEFETSKLHTDFMIGLEYQKLNDYNTAIPYFQTVRDANDFNLSWRAAYRLAESLEEINKLADADKAYQFLIDNYPNCSLYDAAVIKKGQLK